MQGLMPSEPDGRGRLHSGLRLNAPSAGIRGHTVSDTLMPKNGCGNLQSSGFPHRQALAVVSQELGHSRPDITEVYLR